jgi:DNA-binding CsgD family transcriptional regulator
VTLAFYNNPEPGMAEQLKKILDESGIGVCIADRDGNIVFQNEFCVQSCDKAEHGTCLTKNVLICKHARALTSGTIRVPMQQVNGEFFDILGIASKNHRTIYLVPAEESKVAEFRKLDTSVLTQKEKEVVALMIADFSREKIAEILGVSENTIKTHIKSVYAKLPAKSGELIRGKSPGQTKKL